MCWIWGDITESSEISARSGGNLTRSSEISAGFGKFLPEINYFGLIFHHGWFQLNRPFSGANSTPPIQLPCQSAADQNFLHPILSGWSRVGHISDPDRPVDTPTLHFTHGIKKVSMSLVQSNFWPILRVLSDLTDNQFLLKQSGQSI